MRPAALPPSTVTATRPMTNSQRRDSMPRALYTTQTRDRRSPPALRRILRPYFTAGRVGGTSFAVFLRPYHVLRASTPVVYTGDPGVRNPFLNQGYVTGRHGPTVRHAGHVSLCRLSGDAPTPPTPTAAGRRGIPCRPACHPAQRGLPDVGRAPPSLPTAVVMPPPIPPARLFQIPDASARGSRAQAYVGSPDAAGRQHPAGPEQRHRFRRPVDQQHGRQPASGHGCTPPAADLHAEQRVHQPDVVRRDVLPRNAAARPRS